MQRRFYFRQSLCGAVVGGALLGAAPARANDPTFARDVAPLLYRQCVSCHRAGQVAPFSLLTYRDAAKRARQIAVVCGQRVMPPWKPDPDYGAFLHERRLSDAQIALLKRWADAGAPEGAAKDCPPPPRFAAGWQLGKPDLVLRMPKAFTISADGADVNRSFVVPVHLPAGKYLRAAEFRPGNFRVVHHATVMFDTSGKARKFEQEQGGAGDGYVSFGGPGFLPSGGLPGYAPGMDAQVFPADASGVLPKDVDVVFGMHYHPSGKPETDQSTLCLYFTNRAPARKGSLVPLSVLKLDIAPGENNHRVQDSYTLPVPVVVESVFEHMHWIGKACRLWATLPDGTTRPLIRISDWDFNWQSTYHLKEPLRLPKGTVLHAEWSYDNSAENIRNPRNPPGRVTYGENTADEMAGALLFVYVDNDGDNSALWLANLGHLLKSSVTPAQESLAPSSVSAAPAGAVPATAAEAALVHGSAERVRTAGWLGGSVLLFCAPAARRKRLCREPS